MYIDLKAKLVFLQTFLLMNYFFKHKKRRPKIGNSISNMYQTNSRIPRGEIAKFKHTSLPFYVIFFR